MNTLLQKNDPTAIGKPVTASVPVMLHSTATNSPTGYEVAATSELGNLVAWESNPQGEDWLKLELEGHIHYVRFLPGSFYVLTDGDWLKSNKLGFFKKPLGMFVLIIGGALFVALIFGIVVFNNFKPKTSN